MVQAQLTEAELYAPDLDEGELDVEHYRLPPADSVTDPYMRQVWNNVLRYFEDYGGVTENVFCATGPGGGVDPTCGKGDVGAGDVAELATKGWHLQSYHEKWLADGSVRLEEVKIADIVSHDKEPISAVDAKGKTVTEMRSDLESGYRLPVIELTKLPDGKYKIVDGRHRLTAQMTRGKSTIPAIVTVNVFCATGPGGGVDPTCSRGGSGRGSWSARSVLGTLQHPQITRGVLRKIELVNPKGPTNGVLKVPRGLRPGAIAAIEAHTGLRTKRVTTTGLLRPRRATRPSARGVPAPAPAPASGTWVARKALRGLSHPEITRGVLRKIELVNPTGPVDGVLKVPRGLSGEAVRAIQTHLGVRAKRVNTAGLLRRRAAAPAPTSAPSSAPVKIPPTGSVRRSQARVVTSGIWHNEEAERFVRQHGFAENLQHVASLVGAPDNATVKVTLLAGPHRSPSLHVTTSHPEFNNIRTFEIRNGKKYIHNDWFKVNPGQQTKGLGTKVFSEQVHHAREAGYAAIETYAARSETMNGYYTWPRLGYDQSLSDFPRARDKFPNARTVLDIMETKEGREWWKDRGTDMYYAKFDLTPGSRSQKTLEKYLAERAAGQAAKVATTTTNAQTEDEFYEEIELDWDDLPEDDENLPIAEELQDGA